MVHRFMLWVLLAGNLSGYIAAAEPFAVLQAREGKVQMVGPREETGTSRAVIVGRLPLAHTGQLLPMDGQGKLVGADDAGAQAVQVFKNLDTALSEVGSSLAQVVKLNVYVADDSVVAAVNKFVAQTFQGELRPACTLVVTRLPHAQALVAADAVAVVNAERPPQQVVARRVAALGGTANTTHVAVLPAGSRVYVSGQAEPGDLKTATRKTLESLRATLKFLGRGDSDIVQLKAFLEPMSAAEEVLAEFATFFGERPVPPVVLVEWKSKLPIEIELVAAASDRLPGGKETSSPPPGVEYFTPPGLTSSPIFARGAVVHHPRTIFVGGLYGTTGPSGQEQVESIFAQLSETLKAAGSDLTHLAKATYYVATDDASQKLNALRPNYYDPQRPPAASKAMVRSVGRGDRTITLDMIAVPSMRED